MAVKATTGGRRMRGFERADGLLAGRIRTASEGRGFAVTRLLTHWAEIAGPDLARHTRPVKIAYGREGFGATLTLLARGAMAPMIEAELPRLVERVNAVYGFAAIARIRLTQTAAEGFAEGQAQFGRTPAAEPGQVTPAARAAAEKSAGDVEDEGLRLALSELGSHILTRSSDRKKGS